MGQCVSEWNRKRGDIRTSSASLNNWRPQSWCKVISWGHVSLSNKMLSEAARTSDLWSDLCVFFQIAKWCSELLYLFQHSEHSFCTSDSITVLPWSWNNHKNEKAEDFCLIKWNRLEMRIKLAFRNSASINADHSNSSGCRIFCKKWLQSCYRLWSRYIVPWSTLLKPSMSKFL